MLAFKIDYGEIEKIQRFLKKATFESDKAVRFALDKVALEIRRDTIGKVPRDKGGLINSWKVEKSGYLSINAGYDIVYAMYQHQGRRADGSNVIKNRPAGGQSFYLKETIDQNFDKYIEIFEKEVFKRLGWL